MSEDEKSSVCYTRRPAIDKFSINAGQHDGCEKQNKASVNVIKELSEPPSQLLHVDEGDMKITGYVVQLKVKEIKFVLL